MDNLFSSSVLAAVVAVVVAVTNLSPHNKAFNSVLKYLLLHRKACVCLGGGKVLSQTQTLRALANLRYNKKKISGCSSWVSARVGSLKLSRDRL